MAVNKIISFIHECMDERTSDVSFVDTLHMILPAMELLTMLTRIGSGALQAVKGNVFYPILQAFRSQDDGVGYGDGFSRSLVWLPRSSSGRS